MLINFQTFFTVRIRIKFVIIQSLTDLTIPQMCLYTTLWNVSALKATIENKTSVTTYFNKLTTGNNVFIVSVIV